MWPDEREQRRLCGAARGSGDVSLPQLDGPTFITDGGMETVLIFHEGLELPDFASFVLLDDEDRLRGAAHVLPSFPGHRPRARRRCPARHADLASEPGLGRGALAHAWTGSPTSTAAASRCWKACGPRPAGDPPPLISGCIGPRGDGYVVGEQLSPAEAERFIHPFQAECLRRHRAQTPSAR